MRKLMITAAVSAAVAILPATAAVATAAPAIHNVRATSGEAADLLLLRGDTALTLAPATAAVLTSHGVSVTPVGGARVRAGAVQFPITFGYLDPKTLAGRILHSGGLKLSAGSISLTVGDFIIDTATRTLSARVAGTATRIPLLSLDLSKAAVAEPAGGVKITGVSASLTGAAAKALNATFGVSLFSGGLPIGTTRTHGQGFLIPVAALSHR